MFGDYVYQNQVIGQVGPYHVYNVPNNPYTDKQGLPTNGSTTGCHLHFAIKIDGTYQDPLSLIPLSNKDDT